MPGEFWKFISNCIPKAAKPQSYQGSGIPDTNIYAKNAVVVNKDSNKAQPIIIDFL